MDLLTLMEAQVNKVYRIVDILGNGGERRRLLDMGFTPMSKIYVASIAPFGGTILVSLRGFMVALREDAARLIAIEVDNGR